MTVNDPPYHQDRRIRFDGTITAGNILTAGGMILALVVWGVRLEGRVDQQDQARVALEQRVSESTAQTRSIEQEIKQALRDLSNKLDRLIERAPPQREQAR